MRRHSKQEVIKWLSLLEGSLYFEVGLVTPKRNFWIDLEQFCRSYILPVISLDPQVATEPNFYTQAVKQPYFFRLSRKTAATVNLVSCPKKITVCAH